MIKVCNISKYYGSLKAIDNVSFSLNRGQTTAFLGLNGAGKTTLMNILSGVIVPTAGDIFFDDKKVDFSVDKTKTQIGYLPENNPLYEDMYVREYIEYTARFYMSEKKAINLKTDLLIEILGLSDEYKKKIGQLSYGNKKKVGLAQAIVHNPDILILDEPTNGLDPSQCENIKSLIQEIGKNKIILFSSHRFEEVHDIASHYLIINKGKLVFDDQASNVESIQETFFELTK